MALRQIARLGHPVLRQPTHTLSEAAIGDPATQRLIEDMVATMRDADGVGLAAPQVHEALRVFVVEVQGDNPRYPGQSPVPLTIAINPVVEFPEPTSPSARCVGWEGCLSIPDLRGRVPRWPRVRLQARDHHGQPFTREATGFFARVIQHEMDHLEETVFLDRVEDRRSLTHVREFARYF
jgi:peptide deformylase